MAEEGNGDVGGDAGLPEARGSMGRKRGSRRSLWDSRGSEGRVVAAATVNGVGGCALLRERGRGRRSREREKRCTGE